MSKSRAKYICNPKLEEFIQLSNIVPADFDFDWSFQSDSIGDNPIFRQWMKKLLELSDVETARLLDATIDGHHFPIKENFQDIEDPHRVVRFGGLALIQFFKLKPIRSFLRSLIKLNELRTDDAIGRLSPEDNIFESIDRLHSDVGELFKLSACQKVYEAVRKDSPNVERKKMVNYVVHLTSNLIAGDAIEGMNISDEEKSEFLDQWTQSFAEKFPIAEIGEETFRSLDVLAQSVFNIESRISSVNASIDSSGNVQFELNDFAKSLQGVNISRLRLCEYCNKIFWANRKDSFTCSTKHARNRRMRLLRENWKEKGDLYINARKKKAKKKKESKENGSL